MHVTHEDRGTGAAGSFWGVAASEQDRERIVFRVEVTNQSLGFMVEGDDPHQ